VRELGSIDFYHPPALRGWAQLRLGHLLTRMRAGLQRPSLNAALASGADPCESAALAYCAARLTRDRTREKLAGWVEEILDAAARPTPRLSSAVKPLRDEVTAARPLLIQVAELVRSTAPLYSQGLAMLEELLRDGGGPLYSSTSRGALGRELELIIAALEGCEHPDDR
jgi:hypothetical protein